MSSSHQVSADLARRDQQLVKLQVIVAETAWNRRPSREILRHERANNIFLESTLLIDHVIGNAQPLSYVARVINVVNGTAASLDSVGHAVVSSQPPLVPQLQCHPYDGIALLAKH